MLKKTTPPQNRENRKMNTQTIGWFQWVVSKAKSILAMRVFDVVNDKKGDEIKTLISMMFSWKIPRASLQWTDIFMKKATDAKDEWAFHMQDIKNKECLKDIYEGENLFFWTKGDNFWHYRFESTYKGRRIGIMFYNSADYHGQKVSFEELVQKNEPVRVCFYS